MDNYKLKNGIYCPSNEIIRPVGFVELVFRDAITKEITKILKGPNLFVNNGKYGLADLFRGNTANNRGQPTYLALGSSSVAPAAGDTQLGTETFRKQISVRSASLNVATFQTFFDTSEANGTFAEAGLFGDSATATPNSGTLYTHALFAYTKDNTATLTITWTVTF